MDIKSVQLLTEDTFTQEAVEPQFSVTYDDGNGERQLVVPANPANRHYQEIKEWYENQEQKPFEFDFTIA